MEPCTYTQEQVEAMQNVDIRSVDPDTLRDIRDVKVNTNLPKPPRQICGEGQLHRHRRDTGGQDALVPSLKMLRKTFLRNTLDIAGKLC